MNAVRARRLTQAGFSTAAPSLLAVLGLSLILVGAGFAWAQTRLDALRSTPPPVRAAAPVAQADVIALHAEDFTLAPEALRALSAEGARAWNAALPPSTLPVIAAKPFVMAPDDIEAYGRALDCLTAAVYYEAVNEPGRGQAAVAQVVVNRMRHPAYPKTICGVVFEGHERSTGCQFSFTCDGALGRPPTAEGWARARAVAAAALNGVVAPEVGMATHYHADYVAPFWAPRLVKIGQLGAHIFYRWTGAWGLPHAFTGRHAGEEPIFLAMAPILTTAVQRPVEPAAAPIEVLGAEPLLTPTPALARLDAEQPDGPAGELLVSAPEAPAQAAAAAPTPVLADPLAGPGAAPAQRRRPRIAAPSGW